MKIWIKYLIGAIIGIILGMFFSDCFADPSSFIHIGKKIFIGIGKYAFFPLVFFSAAISVFKLLTDHLFTRFYLKLILFTVITTLIMAFIGGISGLFLSPERIPVLFEKEAEFAMPDFSRHIEMIFPENFFTLFVNSSNYIMPIFFLAFLIGINLQSNNIYTKPIIQIFDSMSRIFFEINNLIIEFLPLGIIFLAAFFSASISSIKQINLYKYLFITLTADSVITVFILLPAAFYFTGSREGNPFKYIYALCAPALAAFFSGDIYFGAGTLFKSSFDNLGIKRKASSSAIGFLSIFSRAGTAMVTAAAFIMIIKSYSGIEISFVEFFKIISMAFLFSFVLGSVPGYGAAASIIMICSWYGHGIEDGYLIMQPVVCALLSFSVFIDIMIMGFINTTIAYKENLKKEVDTFEFT